MNVQTLETTITKARDADGTLAFTGLLVASSDIDVLLQAYFTNGAIQLAASTVALSPDKKSLQVGGTTDYQQLRACAVAIILTPGDTSLFMTAELVPADGWTLQSAFPSAIDPSVSGLRFTNGGLVICSAAYQEPRYGLMLARGMSLVASHDVTSSFGYLKPILAETTVVPIHGAVTDPVLPAIVLQTKSFGASLAGTAMTDASLIFTLGNLAEPGKPPIGYAKTTLQATLKLGGDATGIVQATLPVSTSLLSLCATFDGVNLADFSLLTPFIGSVDPVASLPRELQAAVHRVASAFALKQVGLSFDLANAKFLSANVQVAIDSKGSACTTRCRY
jgi:hypothetical protein